MMGVQAIWQLLSRKGLINLDFADLRATLGSKHCDGLFSYGQAEGTNKARDAVKALLDNLPRGNWCRIFIGHPSRVHAVHVNPVVMVIRRRGARHHIQRGLGHIGVGMTSGLLKPVELALHGGYIDDVFVALRRAQH